MSRVEFHRVDLPLVIRRSPDGGASVCVSRLDDNTAVSVDARTVRRWLASDGELPGARFSKVLLRDFGAAVRVWQSRARTFSAPPDQEFSSIVKRITIDVDEPVLAGLPWESALGSIAGGVDESTIVRVSPVPAQVVSTPLTLPIRVLLLDHAEPESLRQNIRGAFGERAEEEIDHALVTAACEPEEVSGGRLPQSWPTAEVLHFGKFPRPREGVNPMSTSSPFEYATLGWLSRLTAIAQTRLVVLPCLTAAEIVDARSLGTALVGKGGPAVLLVAPWLAAAGTDELYSSLYKALIHDFPLDETHRALSLDDGSATALIAGAGREEALRVSQLGLNLISFNRGLRDGPGYASQLRFLRKARHPQAGAIIEVAARPSTRQIRSARVILDGLESEWNEMEFQFHESDGFLPLSDRLMRVRRSFGISEPRDEPRVVDRMGIGEPSRFVNSALWSWRGDHSLERLDPTTTRLVLGAEVLLGVQIGPRDEFVPTLGAEAILEEVFKWTPESEGVWIEIGVTGLDFDVVGAPLREVWLPRTGATETLHFALAPRQLHVSRLRFCVYYQQNLIQSFRLAALTRAPSRRDIRRRKQESDLARALDVSTDRVTGFRYLSRLEYSLETDLEGIEKIGPRAVSILANDLGDGESVVTVKGADVFSVRTNRDLPRFVERLRDTMNEVSKQQPETNPPIYAFAAARPPKEGEAATFDAAVQRMAHVGWQLYDKIIPRPQRSQLEACLEGERKVIHVGHILLEKVVPWAALYDRKFDPKKRHDGNGNRVQRGVCHAALSYPLGTLPCPPCGAVDKCLLHPQAIEKRRQRGEPAMLAETVVCPSRFWGFRHIIELPPQQVRGEGTARDQRLTIDNERAIQLVAGFNASLALANLHQKELAKLASARSGSSRTWPCDFDRDTILKRLESTDIDLVYFFCHARGGRADPQSAPPYLEVQEAPPAAPGQITSDDLDHDQPWTHHPLVFLNGCGTAGFSPDALSPFITKLVEDRGASAVVGTEIPVFESLAHEFSIEFLRRFLAGASAGSAMLEVRRRLFAQGNPLGAAYTLYGPAQLRIRNRGGGSEAS